MVATQAITLKKMRYRLRTALGDSKKHYQHSDSTPIHGTGQGSCASPALWLLISSILMDCLSELGGGMTINDVNSQKSIMQWIDGFVDDTSLFVNLLKTGNDPNDIQALHKHLKEDMIIWMELLEASGGKLELSKCFYYVLSWKFDAEGKAIATTIREQRKVSEEIKIQTCDSMFPVTIKQKEVEDAHKTLGCYKTIEGNEKVEVKFLKGKSDKYGVSVKNATFSRKEASMSFNGVYIPSMKYGLPSTSLTIENIDHIQKFAVDKFTSAIGYEHSIPRAVLFGPKDFGGVGLKHLFTEMMGMKIEVVIAHIRSGSTLGDLITTNINYLQLLSGTDEPILASTTNLKHLGTNWILHIRDYLMQINAQIEIKNLWKLSKQTSNDKFIMKDRKSTRLNSSHSIASRMPSSA